MIETTNPPLWAAVLTAVFVLIGAVLALIGSFGLLRLRTFYERVHAPTLGTTLGIGCVLIASIIHFSVLQTRLVLHEVLIAIFMVVTTPVTLMLLARAALYRDRREARPEVPLLPPPPGVPGDAPVSEDDPHEPVAADQDSA